MSFFHSVTNWLGRLFKSAPKWQTIAKSTLLYTAPLVETAITLINPSLGAEATDIISKIQVGLAAAGATLDGAGDGSSLTAILGSVKTNLGALLAAAQVNNPDTEAKITATTNLIIGELDAILSAIPSSTTPAK